MSQSKSVMTNEQMVSESDHVQLSRLVTEHAWRVDNGRADTIHELYIDDGELTLPPGPLRGRESLREWGRHIVDNTPWKTIRHVCGNMRFVYDGENVAIGTTVLTVYMAASEQPSTTLPFNVGEDHDRFVRTKEGWKFASRKWVELFARGELLKSAVKDNKRRCSGCEETRRTTVTSTQRQSMVFETIKVRREEGVLFAEITAPPLNLLGPALVRDLVSLIQHTESDNDIQVIVFKSGDPDYFISHVDVTRIKENREEAAKLIGDASLGQLFRYLSVSRLITIAQIEGRVRGVGSEFILACDMRFAARESAIFGQFEPSFGVIPGAGGAQHLTRLMGRGRALEVMLSAQDYDADLAERYGWINRALPADEIDEFVSSLAHRIAKFPAAGHAVVKERVNGTALPTVEEIRRDSDLFLEGTRTNEFQELTKAAMKRGFQTREAEMDLGQLVADLEEK